MDKIMEPEDCQNMENIRLGIDSLDNQIVGLIAKRAQYVAHAAKFKVDKNAVRDKERVAAVIASKKELARKHGLSTELIGKVYEVMIDHFIAEEIKTWEKNQEM